MEEVPPVAGKPGHPRLKPDAVLADCAYDGQLKGFRRLRLRYERTAFVHEAILSVAMCLACFRHLQTNS